MTGDVISIEKGRHPVIEQTIRDGLFVSNDTWIDRRSQHADHHRTEHVRKIHLYAADGPDRPHGPGRLLRSRFKGADRRLRQDIHQDRRIR